MSDRLETIDGKNWEEFLASPTAFLMLGKNGCDNCARWTEELTARLEDAAWWPDVRFGKMLIDTPGLLKFKKANPWLAEVEDLPFNLVYRAGERTRTWAGGGADRLDNRLKRVLGET